MTAIRFEVPLVPTAKGRPRFARIGKFVRAFNDKRTEEAERNFVALAVAHAPERPIEGPVVVTVEFHFPPPKSWPPSSPSHRHTWSRRPGPAARSPGCSPGGRPSTCPERSWAWP